MGERHVVRAESPDGQSLNPHSKMAASHAAKKEKQQEQVEIESAALILNKMGKLFPGTPTHFWRG